MCRLRAPVAGCIVLMLWITSSGFDPSLKLWDSWGLAALVPSLSPDRWYLELMYISTIRQVRVRVGFSVRLGVKAPLPPVAGAPLPLPLPLPLKVDTMCKLRDLLSPALRARLDEQLAILVRGLGLGHPYPCP